MKKSIRILSAFLAFVFCCQLPVFAEKEKKPESFPPAYIGEEKFHDGNKNDGYELINGNEIVKDGKTVFKADEEQEINDFYISGKLLWLLSGENIIRVRLPGNKQETIKSGIDKNKFGGFVYAVSENEILYNIYSEEFIKRAEKEEINPSGDDKFKEFIKKNKDIPVFNTYYFNFTDKKLLKKDVYLYNGSDEIFYGWWKEKELIKGDGDFDGRLTAADARLILRASVALDVLPCDKICDIDSDGKITASDARTTLRYSVGLFEETITADEFSLSLSGKIAYDDTEYLLRWFTETLGIRSWWDTTHTKAGNLIYEALKGYGYSGKNLVRAEFEKNGITGRNIIAKIPTEKENPKILTVIAHYDTARGTGAAIDNSSGAAVLMQLAKIFKAENRDFGLEIRFLFTDGEEQGYYGAYAYVDAQTDDELKRHLPVFNIDMAGRPAKSYTGSEKYYLTVCTETVSTGGYEAPEAKENSASTAFDKARSLTGGAGEDGYYSPVRAGAHDILPFRKKGVEGMTVSWRRICSDNSRGSDYDLAAPSFIHMPEDSMEHIDIDSVYKTAVMCAAALGEIIYIYYI